MRKRIALAAVLAATAALGAAQPAAAADDFSVTSSQEQNGYKLNQSAEGHIVRRANGMATVWLRCGTTALHASGTGLKQCYLLGANGLKYGPELTGAKPGPHDAIVDVREVPDQAYRICVQGSALFVDTGYAFLATPTCST
jgi:hypothetical protein